MSNKDYKSLTIPKLAWDKATLTERYGELIAHPLEPGFGITLGNALRRTILGSVEGAAVTSIVVKGINNEFSTIPGLQEDAMQLVLNIKRIVVRNKTGIPGVMKLKKKGPCTVTVEDIVADEHLETVNKDHVIATVADDGELDIEFAVENGRGYIAAQWPAGKMFQEDSRIYLDAMFSPVEKVSFDVQKTRVGKEIDYDKLTIKITTNGAEDPVSIMHYAVSVLRTQLEYFLTGSEIPFNEISAARAAEEAAAAEEGQVDGAGAKLEGAGIAGLPLELLLGPIDDLELSVRAHNCLINAGIKRTIDLVNLSDEAVLKIKNFGRKSLTEVKEGLRTFGLAFGMGIKESDVRKALGGE